MSSHEDPRVQGLAKNQLYVMTYSWLSWQLLGAQAHNSCQYLGGVLSSSSSSNYEFSPRFHESSFLKNFSDLTQLTMAMVMHGVVSFDITRDKSNKSKVHLKSLSISGMMSKHPPNRL